MAQRKETKTKVKVRDLKPKNDAKGGRVPGDRPGHGVQQSGGGKQMSRIWGP